MAGHQRPRLTKGELGTLAAILLALGLGLFAEGAIATGRDPLLVPLVIIGLALALFLRRGS